jgi:two-component system response regulator HydG
MIPSADRRPVILIVDDEAGILESLRILLKGEGFEPRIALGGREGLKQLEAGLPDIVLTDIRMPLVTGVELLARARALDADLPVVLMTAEADLQSAIRAVNEGAFHYIQKPFRNDELVSILRRAAEHRSLRAENRVLRQQVARAGVAERPIGRSKAWLDVLKIAETVAPTDATVLITGESGTGKEVVARYVHALSQRSAATFQSINCGALPEGLLESELFGHVKGSFTGAVRDKEGLFAAASGGTFFLDEIGETTPATQVKLLRVLQHREVIRVGATEAEPIDVRLVAATNRDLEVEMQQGRFRSDLFYRLNVIALYLPPLRQRAEDIMLLADGVLERLATERKEAPKVLSPATREALERYPWPGNVRELSHALERAVLMTPGAVIEPSALPDRVTERRAEPLVSADPPANPTLDTIERAYILWVLQGEGGNKTRAAEVLGIDPSTLHRKLSRYGVG